MADKNSNSVQYSVRKNGRFQIPWSSWATRMFVLSLFICFVPSETIKRDFSPNYQSFNRAPKLLDSLRFMFLDENKSAVPTKKELDKVMPILKPTFDSNPTDNEVIVTWLGHSTTVVQMNHLTILTDPVFSERASPFQFLGPKRFRSAACTVSELPPIDAVIISHDHYDHLDYNSVKSLNKRFGEQLHWFVPLGLAEWMKGVGVQNVVELNWWQSTSVSANNVVYKFVFTPAQHWSGRSWINKNKSLWGSWVIIGPNNRFFFAGDTGYSDCFKEIGDLYGPFNVAAIPIGAYAPRDFMKPHHINPDDAVQIHEDVRSMKSVAIHWGTFALAHEYYLEPPMKLKNALEDFNLPEEAFIAMKHGETRHFQ